MASPISEQIIDNIVALLGTITKGATYEKTINEVSRMTSPAAVKFSTPIAADVVIARIVKSDEEEFDFQLCEMTAEIGVYVKDAADPGGTLSTVCADIEKALAIDHTRGGLAFITKVVAIEYDYVGIHDYSGVGVVEINVIYEHERNDPYSQT